MVGIVVCWFALLFVGLGDCCSLLYPDCWDDGCADGITIVHWPVVAINADDPTLIVGMMAVADGITIVHWPVVAINAIRSMLDQKLSNLL